jgi:hypothetical protein
LSLYTIRLKFLLRGMAQESGKVTGWDEEVAATIAVDFKGILEDLKALRDITFPRSIRPPESRGHTVSRPMLMMFDNGSREASCALAYARWQMEDGYFFCRLVADKTRVAPKPAGVRGHLGHRDQDQVRPGGGVVLGADRLQPGRHRDTAYSPAQRDGGGLRVTEQDGVDEETSGGGAGEEDSHTPPLEECRKDMMLAVPRGVATAEVTAVQVVETANWQPYPPRASSLARLTRVCAYELWFLARVRRVSRCEKRPMLERPTSPPRECMEAAKWMLLEAAQKDLPLRKMELPMAEKRTRRCVLGVERTLLVVVGRSKKYMRVAHDQEYLPLLLDAHPLSRLYLLDSHDRDHRTGEQTAW